MSTLKRIIFVFIVSYWLAPQCFAQTDFYQRLDRFKSDVEICHAFVAKNVCDKVELSIKHRHKFEKKVNNEKLNEEMPITIKYFNNRELQIAILGNTELLLDTVVHYYLLNNDILFVVRIETPHVEQLKDQIGENISPRESFPVYYGFLFIRGKLKAEYSEQGNSHPKIPKSKVSDVLSVYQAFVAPKASRLRNDG